MTDAKFGDVPVAFRDGTTGTARTCGNFAAWVCQCGQDRLPLLGMWFPYHSESVCPTCGRRYKFLKDDRVTEINV